MWSPSSWVGCSRSSSRTTLLIVEPGAQDHHHVPLFLFRSLSCVALLVREPGAQDHCRAPLFLLLNRALKIVIVCRCEWQRSKQELHTHRELLIVDPRCHEFTRMNLSASPLPGALLLMSGRQIFGVGSEGTQVGEINLTWTQDTRVLDWFRPSHGVIALCPVLMYHAIEIGSSLSFGIFRGFSGIFCGLSSMWIYPLYL
jgi:hypothetical protein